MTREEILNLEQLKLKLQTANDIHLKEKKELYNEIERLQAVCNEYVFKAVIYSEAVDQKRNLEVLLKKSEEERKFLYDQLQQSSSSTNPLPAFVPLISNNNSHEEISLLKTEIQNKSRRISSLEVELTSAKREIQAALDREKSLSSELSSSKALALTQIEAEKSSSASLRSQIEELNSQKSQTQIQLAQLKKYEDETKALEQKNIDLAFQLEALRMESEKDRQKLQYLSSTRNEKTQEIELQLEKDKALLLQKDFQIKELELKIKELELKIKELNDDIHNKESRLNSLEIANQTERKRSHSAEQNELELIRMHSRDLFDRVKKLEESEQNTYKTVEQFQMKIEQSTVQELEIREEIRKSRSDISKQMSGLETRVMSCEKSIEELPSQDLIVDRVDARIAGRLSHLNNQIELLREETSTMRLQLPSTSSSSNASTLLGLPPSSSSTSSSSSSSSESHHFVTPTSPVPKSPLIVPSLPTPILEDKANDEIDTKSSSKKRSFNDVELPRNKRHRSKESKDVSSKPEVVVCFTGFKEEGEYNFNSRRELIERVIRLGGIVRTEAEFDKSITHVVTPPGVRTLKSLAALLTKRWLVSIDWILQSEQAGYFIPEDKFGKRLLNSPLKGKRFMIAESFKREALQKNNNDRLSSCNTVIQMLGRGKLVEDGEADYLLVSSKDNETTYRNAKRLNWANFMDLITKSESEPQKQSEVDFSFPPSQDLTSV